jgi:DNA polymerase-3 subunit beta
MHILIEKDRLAKALMRVNAAVESRSTIPVLLNVLLEAEGNMLSLSGTDLDIEVRSTTEARVTQAGTITAPSRELFDIAKRAPDGSEIELSYESSEDPRLTVRVGRSKWRLHVLPAGDFPVMSGITNAVSYDILPSALARLIDKTRSAMSTEATRYYLCGAFLHCHTEGDDTFLRMVATDGNRLNLADTPAPEGAATAPGVIIPSKAIRLIDSIIDGHTTPVTVRVNESKFALDLGHTVMTSKIIDGSFPDYMRVVSKGRGDTVVKLRALALSKGLDAVGIVSAEKVRSTRWTIGDEGLHLTVNSLEKGQADAIVEATFEGAPIELGFNSKYVADMCSTVGDTAITCHITSPAAPMRVEDAADPNATFILMPLRV